MRACAEALIALLLLATPVGASDAGEAGITGRASVVDGDTLDVGPLRVRLNGIDAPEIGQACATVEGRAWDRANAAAV